MINYDYRLSDDSLTSLDKKKLASFIIKENILTQNKKVLEYEKVISKKFKSRFALFLNSGSSANLLAIYSLFFIKNKPIKKGDEVLVSGIGWATTYSPLIQLGLKIRLCDVDRNNFNISLKNIKKTITKKTKLLLLVNLLGYNEEIQKIYQFCKKQNILIVLDNCEGMGAKINNRYVNNYADITTMSSYFSHHISTIEGGYLLTNSEEIFVIAMSLRSHGWGRGIKNHQKKFIGIKNPISKVDNFHFFLPGFNFRSTEINAFLGLMQIKKLDKFLKAKKDNATYLLAKLKEFEFVQTISPKKGNANFLLALIFNDSDTKNMFSDYLNKSKYKIEYRSLISGPITKHNLIKYMDINGEGILQNASDIDSRTILIGNHSKTIYSKINKLILLMREFANEK